MTTPSVVVVVQRLPGRSFSLETVSKSCLANPGILKPTLPLIRLIPRHEKPNVISFGFSALNTAFIVSIHTDAINPGSSFTYHVLQLVPGKRVHNQFASKALP